MIIYTLRFRKYDLNFSEEFSSQTFLTLSATEDFIFTYSRRLKLRKKKCRFALQHSVSHLFNSIYDRASNMQNSRSCIYYSRLRSAGLGGVL